MKLYKLLFQAGIATAVVLTSLLIPTEAKANLNTSAKQLLVQNELTKVIGVKLEQTTSGLTQILHLIRQKSKPLSFNQCLTVSN
ncbi:hypothetical protein IQ255_15835 [Pleurocapsales cyanobacterium LEGE 10410]|nr:hypothetical protein [Pleurocapsales cyanobacterium LEGE 10410]